jgi:drug/metabolite transporter (DMT)-like permease
LCGEIFALATAFFLALTSTLVKTQASKMSAVALSAWRRLVGLVIFVTAVILLGKAHEVAQLSASTLILLIGATLIGPGVGDLLYIRSLKLIDQARAMQLNAIYPFFTFILAALFLDEHYSSLIVPGAFFIAGGSYLLAFSSGQSVTEPVSKRSKEMRGILLALAAAAAQAVSTVMLRLGVANVDPMLANSIRYPALVLILFGVLIQRGELHDVRHYSRRTLIVVFLAGFVGTGVAMFTLTTALQTIGAGRTSILTSTMPLFGVPLSILFLKEKISARTWLGTLLTVAGVILVISNS